MKKKNSKHTTKLLFFILFAGIFLLIYPTVSDYWNSFHQTKAINNYTKEIAQLDTVDYEIYWKEARAYNEKLIDNKKRFSPDEEEKAKYNTLLNLNGTGIMGYLNIPSIRCKLPIYHGTEEAVLQIAVGHIQGSSLPVGGEGSHCVLSGHRGLTSAKLFTDLDKLTVGDEFEITVLDETIAYKVDQIRIVLPHEIEDIKIEEGKDYCTLVTCTPYGVNSHRLLVRGCRTEYIPDDEILYISADAIPIDQHIAIPIVAIPILLILLLILLFPKKRKMK